MVATAACALHCLLLPWLLPILTLSGLGLIASSGFEHAILTATAVLAVTVLSHGYRHHHRRMLPLISAALGVAIYVGRSQFGASWEPVILALGAGCIVAAHWMNLHFLHIRHTRAAGVRQ